MSASDAYVEWWSVDVDPLVVVDRLLAAGLRPSWEAESNLVNVLDEEGGRTPTPLSQFRDLLRGAEERVTYQLWFSESEDHVMNRTPVLLGRDGREADCTTAFLDACTAEQFDTVVGVMASMVVDFPECTLAWVLDGSNDTAAFDWAPVAEGAPVAMPWAPVVVTCADSVATAPGRDWAEGVPAPGLRSTGWPVVEGGDPVSWYWWCRR